MLAISSGIEQFLILALAGIIGAAVLGAGRAVMGLIRTRQTKQRQNTEDQRTLSEFFFGVEADPRTRTPGREGWCVKVDRSLEQLTTGLSQVISELIPDGNGRQNLRGITERTAETLGVEMPPPEEEHHHK